jgi:uncharacterized protein YgbK (DUF1537 family)
VVSAIGVLADDLTGALGSAARLRAGGLDPVVVWKSEDLPRELRPRAAVVDMRTRDSPAGPRATAAAWAEVLRKMECTRFEQRIDSTLAGSPAEELAGLLDGAALRDAVVIAVPAWPDAGKVCVNGVVDGVDVAGALFEQVAEVVRPEHLEARVAAGVTRLVVDGSQEADLRAAAVAVDRLEATHTIVTASPGAWLRHHPLSARPRKGFALVVGAGPDGARVDWEAVAAGGSTVVVSAERALDVLRESARRGLKCRGVVAGGGHLASRVVDALGAQRLAVSGEVAPLCARGTLVGGDWAGLAVITQGAEQCPVGDLVEDLWRD